MYSRSYTLLFALLAFATFTFAKPVGVSHDKALAIRHDHTGLYLILDIFVELQKQCLEIIANIHAAIKLDVNADVSVLIGDIIICVNAAIAAIVNVGIIVNLRDLVTIKACAQICADIILSIQACIAVIAHIKANVEACVALDLCLKVLLLTIEVFVHGIVKIVADLCLSVNLRVDIVLTACFGALGLY